MNVVNLGLNICNDWIGFLLCEGTLILAIAMLACLIGRKLRPASKHAILFSSIIALLSVYLLTRLFSVGSVQEELSYEGVSRSYEKLSEQNPGKSNGQQIFDVEIETNEMGQKMLSYRAKGRGLWNNSDFQSKHFDHLGGQYNGSDSLDPSKMKLESSVWAPIRIFVAGVFVAGAIYYFLSLILGIFHCCKMTKASTRISHELLPGEVQPLVNSFVNIFVHPDAATMPFTFRLMSTSVVLPADFLERPKLQQRTIVAHEVAHVWRGDPSVSLFLGIARILMWIHPLFWLISRQIKGTAEQAADEWAVNSNIAPVSYATSLLEIVKSMLPTKRRFAAVSVDFAGKDSLESRIKHIVKYRQRKFRANQWRNSVFALMFFVAFGLFGMIASEQITRLNESNGATKQQQPLSFVSYDIEEEFNLVQ